MPDHKNGKNKKANTKPKKSALMQVGSDKGAASYVSKDSPKGNMAQKAKKLMEMKKNGKKLLRSEELIIKKYFNPTKVRKEEPKTKSYKKKK